MKRGFGINVLAILAGCVLIVGLLQPWWSVTLEGAGPTSVYPYIMRGPITEVLGYRKTSQMVTATYALALAAVLILIGSLLWGWKGRLPLALAGILILLIVWRFLVRISDVAERFNMSIQGKGIAEYHGGLATMEVSAQLAPGLYLAVAAGILCLLSSLLHNRVRLPRK